MLDGDPKAPLKNATARWMAAERAATRLAGMVLKLFYPQPPPYPLEDHRGKVIATRPRGHQRLDVVVCADGEPAHRGTAVGAYSSHVTRADYGAAVVEVRRSTGKVMLLIDAAYAAQFPSTEAP